MVETMKSVQAAIGGEGANGGIIFPAVHPCRDSYTGMAFLLDRLAQTGQTMSALQAELPLYYRKLDQIAYEHGRLGPIMQALDKRFEKAGKDRTDGLKLIFPDGWIHVRASNTEPLLRLGAEATSERRLQDLYEEVLRVVAG